MKKKISNQYIPVLDIPGAYLQKVSNLTSHGQKFRTNRRILTQGMFM